MKVSIFLLILSIFPLAISAQQFKRVFLFDDFIQAQIKFRNSSVSVVLLNYDASNKTMLFRQGMEIMEMTDLTQIDSIIIGKRKFVPAANKFYEVIFLKEGNVYVDWLLKEINIGAKGALGTVTQASVKNLYMSDWGLNGTEMYTPYERQKLRSTDVYKRKNDNTYYISVKGKLEKVKTLKHLKKIFVRRKDELERFAKEQNIDMKNIHDVLVILNYCMGIQPK